MGGQKYVASCAKNVASIFGFVWSVDPLFTESTLTPSYLVFFYFFPDVGLLYNILLLQRRNQEGSQKDFLFVITHQPADSELCARDVLR